MTGWTSQNRRTPRRRWLSRFSLLAAVLIAALSYSAVNQAQVADSKRRPTKLDRVLRTAAANGDTSLKRVIVRARPGRASSIADRLKKHGDRIEATTGGSSP